MKLNVLTIRFANEIAMHEVPLFRGAVIAAVGQDSSVLLHNHEEGNYRYSYPLIQYKRMKGKAAIVCLQEGIRVMARMAANDWPPLRLGAKREVRLQVADVTLVQHELMVDADDVHCYELHAWLPLNSENYTKYRTMDGLAERVQMLERILTGNLLSMAGGLGIYVDVPIGVHIADLTSPPHVLNYKGVKMMAFDVKLKTNMNLPSGIGIGKGNSLGFGIVSEARNGGWSGI